MKFNWQHPRWPDFTYDVGAVQDTLLAYTALANRLTGRVTQLGSQLHGDALIDILIDEALKNAAIEGVSLQTADLRSSLRNQLGLNRPQERVGDPRADNMARLVLAVRESFDDDLCQEDLWQWQTLAVSDPRSGQDVRLGAWRVSLEPMQVVSGPLGQQRVHFEAPPASDVPAQMELLIRWFNGTHPTQGAEQLNGVIRAAIVHLRFESVHPFDDGNGRVGRALAEKALAQDLRAPVLYSLSAALERDRRGYYQALHQASGYHVDLTPWIDFFVTTVLKAQQYSARTIQFTLAKALFFREHTAPLNARQKKSLERMFEGGPDGFEGGMSAAKHARLTRCSKATATRDLVYLCKSGFLRRLPGGGRSTRYELNLKLTDALLSKPA